MNPRWFLRMARWAHRPPSERQVILVLGVIAACLLIGGIEYFIGWPEIFSMQRAPRFRP
jgi:hypothetical protein